jgi:hypothetical protein
MTRNKLTPVQDKVILDLCGGTGAWSRPYKEAGYDVRNITLPDYDVRTYKPPENVYGILAAPPCTHLAISGARWFKSKGKGALLEALSVVDACMRIILISESKFWALENPVGRLVNYLGKPKIYFNPCDYGDPWTKKTCLWGKFNIPVKNKIECNGTYLPHTILSNPVTDGQLQKLVEVRYLPRNYKEIYGKLRDRRIVRAITPSGFAQAFFEANR